MSKVKQISKEKQLISLGCPDGVMAVMEVYGS
jgi:hypothetical protein